MQIELTSKGQVKQFLGDIEASLAKAIRAGRKVVVVAEKTEEPPTCVVSIYGGVEPPGAGVTSPTNR
jgi:hypothetical protein